LSETVPFGAKRPPMRPCSLEEGHNRRERQRSGVWTCTLTTLSPLCIQSVFSKLGDRDPAYIPASSVRGMVRNVMEMLGAGCARFYQEAPYPDHLKPCDAEAACLACRVFGFTDGDEGWAGKVRFADTAPVAVKWVRYAAPIEGRPPQAESHGKGWILFPHTEPSLRPDPRGIRCVPTGQSFTFRVEYLNLDAEELALFKFVLTLKHQTGPDGRPVDLCHKLGFAKALGFGGCNISISKGKTPGDSPEIEAYLKSPAFQVFATHRKRL